MDIVEGREGIPVGTIVTHLCYVKKTVSKQFTFCLFFICQQYCLEIVGSQRGFMFHRWTVLTDGITKVHVATNDVPRWFLTFHLESCLVSWYCLKKQWINVRNQWKWSRGRDLSVHRQQHIKVQCWVKTGQKYSRPLFLTASIRIMGRNRVSAS